MVWASHNQVRGITRDLKVSTKLNLFSWICRPRYHQVRNKIDFAVDGGTVSPFYADNEAEMIAKLQMH